MKRVVCLLLSLILLLGLLPTALADGNSPSWVIGVNDSGAENGQRAQDLRVMYGDRIRFRLYEDETAGSPLTGLQETFYVIDGNPTYPVNGAGVISQGDRAGEYILDTSKFDGNWVELHLHDSNNKDYYFFVIVMVEDIGWFWTRNPSVASALPGGSSVTAKYDGSKDVSVYLTATHTTAGAVLSDDYEAPDGFTVKQLTQYCWRVTCKADGDFQAGDKKELTLPMEKAWTSIYDIGPDYTVTFCADGNAPRGLNTVAPSVIGQLAAIPVTINGRKRTCYMGVGEYNNGKYGVLTSSSMGGRESADMRAQLAVGLWWQTSSGDGTYDLTALSADEVQTVIAQVGEFRLTATAEGEQTGTLNYTEDTTVTAGMPCQRIYTLTGADKGKWRFEASCTVDGEPMTASGTITRTVATAHALKPEQCKTVKAINEGLKNVIQDIESGEHVITVDLRSTGEEYHAENPDSSAYRGQIVIPDIKQNNVDVSVEFRGARGGTTLIGGIQSETAAFSVSNVNFIGNGSGSQKWEVDNVNPNGGAPNEAFRGNSRANARDCTFTGYYVAISCGRELRMCGRNNTFRNNHIAWRISTENKNGGNPDALNCVFEDNEYAIWVESFHFMPSFYAPTGCTFTDNGCDVRNSDRWWFIPGNYFTHNRNPGPVNEIGGGSGNTYCYPMASGGTVDYRQLDAAGDTVSNANTRTYQTPKSALDGKTLKVASAEADTILATFSFDDTAAEQAEEKPVRSVLRARMLRSAVEPSFDATVSVDRSDASKIVFHMENPCKQVTVSLPCSFTDGTVKLGETEILDAEFDGQTVSFQTKKAGAYVIESKTPVQPKPDDAVTGIISGIVASGALQPGASASQFADLTSDSWYYDGVRCALENGLMTGTSARTFAPNRPVTRAMLVTILWRLAGEPYGRVSPFEDVLPGSWYAQAVSWAYDKGIVTGVTATSFQPGAPVTREQLCAILCRYAALTGKNTAASASLDAFTDRAQVSAYAEASVRWALQAGLLTGVGDGRLAPRSGATRAQLAVLLQRFAGLK